MGKSVGVELALRDVLLKGPKAALHLEHAQERRPSSLDASRFRMVSWLAHKMRCQGSYSWDSVPMISLR